MVTRLSDLNNARRADRRRRPDRRGVLLLVVLSILVLFVVIALTFVLVGGHFRRGSKPELIVERYTNDPQRQLDDAVYQVFRGTDSALSVIGPHSLLEDMYGNNSISGYLSAVPTLAPADNQTGQLVDLHVTALVANTFNQINGYYNGQVLTMVSGSARGLSTRIVGYTPNGDTTGTTAIFRVMAFDGLLTSNFIAQYSNAVEQRFVVNGRPFNGTGFGFNPATGQLNASSIYPPAPTPPNGYFQYYAALMPNSKYFSAPNNAVYTIPGGVGGADEDYDAPDPQNMALAWIPVTVNNANQIIPSFHRPDLVKWWQNQNDANNSVQPWLDPNYQQNNHQQNGPTLQRQVIMRPLGPTVGSPANFADHPLFTGSNQNPNGFDPVNGPWDVDNDTDGLTDSVWLDLGYPVQTSPDGKTYKPLFAFLILDLDGRLNVNAHGNIAQAYPADANNDLLNAAQAQGPFAMGSPTTPNNALQNVVQLPRGQGYGPAEINLGYGLINGTNAIFATNGIASYQHLLTGYTGGTAATNFDGRHGEYNTAQALPGLTNATPLNGSADDFLSGIKHFEVPTNYFTQLALGNLTSYGTPSDLWGRNALALDYRGQPVFISPITGAPLFGSTQAPTPVSDQELPNSPYSLNLSRQAVRTPEQTGAIDNPYTTAELERLVRRFDVDSYSLADRLRTILDPTNTNPLLGRLLTTDSYDLPSPNMLITTEVRTQVGAANAVNCSIVDQLRYKLMLGNSTKFGTPGVPPTATTTANINAALLQMLPPEIVSGQYLDINRPLGNGRDDNALAGPGTTGYNVVDEPTEYATNNEAAWGPHWSGLTAGIFPHVPNSTPFDLINGMNFNAEATAYTSLTSTNLAATYKNPQLYARQLLARHLYVLMMTLMDSNYITSAATVTSAQWGNQQIWGGTTESLLTAAQQQEVTARRIAQWAINVVDYRDADSIMTPFEYDVNPFDGWQVDGIVDTVEDTTQNATNPTTTNERRVVWGCEYPELMITETFATHDRRVRDTMNDDGVGGSVGANLPRFNTTNVERDVTMDQIRIPQGSLFVELYCPRPNTAASGGSQAVLPGDLYTYNQANNTWALNLAATAPANNSGFQEPVWRLAILASPFQSQNNNIAQRMQNNPVSTTLDPPDGAQGGNSYNFSVFSNATVTPANFNPSGLGAATIERIAWFTSTPPNNNDPNYNKVYYNHATTQNGAANLAPGGYAVIGPRPLTTFGRVTTNNTANQPGNAPASPPTLSTQSIQITPSVTYHSTNANPAVPYPTVSTNIQQPLGIVCAGPIPANTSPAWGQNSPAAPNGIGLSVSEPLFSAATYYAEPLQKDSAVQAVTAGLYDSYGLDGGASPKPYRNLPYEAYNNLTTLPTLASNPPPLVADTISSGSTTLLQTGTIAAYRTVVLQRLANPLLPYNPMPNDPNEPTPGNPGGYDKTLPVNPYVTVDWMPVNLTVYNGEQVPLTNPVTLTVSVDPDDPKYATPPGTLTVTSSTLAPNYWTAAGANGYGTAQRGISSTTAPNYVRMNLWGSYEDSFPAGSGTKGPASDNLVFDYNLDNNAHTLGFLNRAFFGPNGVGHPWSNGAWASAATDNPPAPATYVGDPNPNFWLNTGSATTNATFPWINWANRPFASHYELMQVPASSPSRLMWEYGFTGTASSPYDGGAVPPAAPPANTFFAPFKHLLNFEMSAPQSSAQGTAPHFYRLFDYVRVPSRFVGTDTLLNPNSTSAVAGGTATNATTLPNDNINEQKMFSYLHPPFNKVSKYRDPGKPNINTIPHLIGDPNPFIWNAVVDDPSGAVNPNPPTAGPSWADVVTSIQNSANWTPGSTPSAWVNPFRSSAGSDFNLPNTTEQRGINATFMRPAPNPLRAGGTPVPGTMLFDFPTPEFATTTATAANPGYQPYNDPNRNSYFRYQNLQQMGNLLTTRSNVYACWVTVGYFQVLPWTGNPATANVVVDNVHPDGYQLADELGADTGSIVRHRGFYIFDRTIPVAFERGLNHNVDRAIILRRYIE